MFSVDVAQFFDSCTSLRVLIHPLTIAHQKGYLKENTCLDKKELFSATFFFISRTETPKRLAASG